ncbi:MAG TPA: CPBP family intramembrane glutamic endopeptidase [Polyangia bacterium]
MSRLKTVALALGFVGVSMACKLLAWGGLSFLSEKSVVRSTVAGVAALGLVVTMTVLAQRRRPSMHGRDLILLPSLGLMSARVAIGGLLGGILIFTVVFALVMATGGIAVRWRPVGLLDLAGTLVAVLVATVLNAAWEEYTFRGWAFSACAKALGPHATAIGLGTTFGLAHLFNPNWTVAAIASVALAGFFLSYSMLASRNILVPIGLHVGWNFTQSLLTSARFWDLTRHANPWRSGGEWGLEGSAAGIAITAFGAAIALAAFLVPSRRVRLGHTPDAGSLDADAAASPPVSYGAAEEGGGGTRAGSDPVSSDPRSRTSSGHPVTARVHTSAPTSRHSG